MSFNDTTSQPSLTAANTASAIRTLITALGTWAVAKGYIQGDMLKAITELAVIIGPFAWAWYKNHNSHKALVSAIAAPAGSAG